ncbi:MAG: biopolymer transporter ExbD [Verrucomicrobium sp.]|nr:biopolymer transporter ExbD [Verrucomicrobium sp.]
MRVRRRRRGGSAAVFERDAEFEFQVAPMADLLFVLLVFFMSVSSVDALRRQKPVVLPAAAQQAARAGAAHEAVVTLDARGNCTGEGRALAGADDVRAWLRARREGDAALRVVLRADKACPYKAVAEVMKLCAAARIPEVTFAVRAGK